MDLEKLKEKLKILERANEELCKIPSINFSNDLLDVEFDIDLDIESLKIEIYQVRKKILGYIEDLEKKEI